MKWWLLGIAVVGSLVMSTYAMLNSSNQRVAFFDIDKVYDEFDMKKELEAKMRKMDEYQGFMIDSLKFQIRAAESVAVSNPNDKNAQNQLNLLYQQFQNISKEFSERNEGVAGQYNKMVLTQIHAKAKEFSKKKGFQYLIGQSESTDLIFYEEGLDVSEEFTRFLNETYAGLNK